MNNNNNNKKNIKDDNDNENNNNVNKKIKIEKDIVIIKNNDIIDEEDENQNDNNTDDNDDDDEDDNEDDLDAAEKEMDEREHLKMAAMLEYFTPEQLDRYEKFRRSCFDKKQIKQFLEKIIQKEYKVPEKLLLLTSSVTKMYVGELIGLAKSIMEERNEHGVIQPRHIREAYRRLKNDGKIPHIKPITYTNSKPF